MRKQIEKAYEYTVTGFMSNGERIVKRAIAKDAYKALSIVEKETGHLEGTTFFRGKSVRVE
jgi:23S rRNA-/tRNA-specific pseudouridylate synthase